MWHHDFFVLRDVHSHVYLPEERLLCPMRPFLGANFLGKGPIN